MQALINVDIAAGTLLLVLIISRTHTPTHTHTHSVSVNEHASASTDCIMKLWSLVAIIHSCMKTRNQESGDVCITEVQVYEVPPAAVLVK